jgi:hypothetical protein
LPGMGAALRRLGSLAAEFRSPYKWSRSMARLCTGVTVSGVA